MITLRELGLLDAGLRRVAQLSRQIGELPLDMQMKLLRVLQEKEFRAVAASPNEVDFRVIAATNRDLAFERWLRPKRFRQDLFYRLNVMRVRLAPLRERRKTYPLSWSTLRIVMAMVTACRTKS